MVESSRVRRLPMLANLLCITMKLFFKNLILCGVYSNWFRWLGISWGHFDPLFLKVVSYFLVGALVLPQSSKNWFTLGLTWGSWSTLRSCKEKTRVHHPPLFCRQRSSLSNLRWPHIAMYSVAWVLQQKSCTRPDDVSTHLRLVHPGSKQVSPSSSSSAER